MLEKASSLRGEWTRIHSDYLNSATGVEGCTMFKFNGEDKWCLLLDKYGAGGYYPSVTTNIESGEFTRLNNSEYKFPSTMRHGTVINITDEEYATLEKKWGNHDSEIEYDTTLAQSAIAHITFDDEEAGFAGNGAAVTANNGYELTEGKFGNAVKLSARDKQFFNLTREDGTSLLTGLDEFTISYWSKSNSSSGTTWSFYAAPDEKAQSSPSEKYIGIIDPLNDSKIHVERYFNGRSNNNDLSMSGLNDKWKMVTVVFFNNATKLYVNGELVSTVSSKVDITDLLGENSIIQLGKANWGTGEYSNISLDELAVFNRPVNSDEVKALYEGTVDYTISQDDPNEDPNNQDDPNEDPNNQDDPNNDPGNQDNHSQGAENQDKPAQESPNQDKPTENGGKQDDAKETPAAQEEPSKQTQDQAQSQTGATTEENKKVDTENVSDGQAQTIVDDKTPTSDTAKSEAETVKSVKGKLKTVKLKNKKKVYRLKLKNGKYAKGLVKFENKLYYFGKNGNAEKGFHKVDGKKIYTNSKGKLAKGFKIIKGSLYYFNKDGSMFTGKLKRGALVYHFGKNGKLKKITTSKK
jgi:glucan-binding YG repeat protein